MFESLPLTGGLGGRCARRGAPEGGAGAFAVAASLLLEALVTAGSGGGRWRGRLGPGREAARKDSLQVEVGDEETSKASTSKERVARFLMARCAHEQDDGWRRLGLRWKPP